MLVLCKFLRQFFNTLTADCKYYVLNRDNLTQRIQILLPQKQKNFSEVLSTFLKGTLNLYHFQKKGDLQSPCISQITVSEKGLLDKCLKNHASEYPTTNNITNRHKHCCNLDDRTFTIFIDHSEHNSVRKTPC